ncbi:MAG: carbohydrate binding family 9 domain-containing protein [Rhodothermia bacterium]|nr:carbohydrate binding family 9 domain-containing protein [Rhodothermia bacterium]
MRYTRHIPVLLFCMTTFVWPRWTVAQAQRTVMQAVRTTTPPLIDGRVDEDIWSQAVVFDTFIQYKPDEGQPVSERTEARVLYDDNALYIAVVCYDRQPERILRRLSRRDRIVESDGVGIAIDSYADRKTSFLFVVNAAGVKSDGLFQNDGSEPDMNWDALWEGVAAMRPDGWSVEYRIPYQALRFAPGEIQTWGILVNRHISRTAEDAMSNPIPRSATGYTSQFGTLEGIRNINPKKTRLVTPYALGGLTLWPSDAEPTWERTTVPEYRVGLDAQVGLTSKTILTMTVNPDFGQVEADQAQLNLTAFETFFPEKRPFFLEGTEIFKTVGALGDDGPRTEMFYTRRIGRRPEGYDDYPDQFDETKGKIRSNPVATPILAAVKLSGKRDNGFAYGLLNAITPATHKRLISATGQKLSYQTAPATRYSVARFQNPLKGAGSYVGGMITGTNRSGATETDAFSGALDFRYNTDDYNVSTEGLWATTRRLTPDGEEQGYHMQARYGSYDHPKFLWQVGVQGSTKGFDANEMGFSQGDNDGFGFLWAQYRNLNPQGKIQQFSVDFVTWHSRVLRPQKLFEQGFNLNPQIQWKNQWFTAFALNLNTAGYDPYESRDHGLYRKPLNMQFFGIVKSDARKPFFFTLNPLVSADRYGKRGWGLQTTFNLNAGSATQLSLEPGMNFTTKETGYADEDTYQGIDFAIFGKRNVDYANLTLRGIHTFRPNLSFQVYGQYFWARGIYADFQKLLPDGRLGELPQPYSGNPHFNYSEVNLNAIARYEFRPGSVLFLVWTQNRSLSEDNTQIGGLDFARNTLERSAANVFLVKASYTIGH